MVVVDVIYSLDAQSLQGLQTAVNSQTEINWSMLLEPSDASEFPSVITLKAVGLPDTGDHACNLLLIG